MRLLQPMEKHWIQNLKLGLNHVIKFLRRHRGCIERQNMTTAAFKHPSQQLERISLFWIENRLQKVELNHQKIWGLWEHSGLKICEIKDFHIKLEGRMLRRRIRLRHLQSQTLLASTIIMLILSWKRKVMSAMVPQMFLKAQQLK